MIDRASTPFAWSFGVVATLVAYAVLWLDFVLSVSPWLFRPQTFVASFNAPAQGTRAIVAVRNPINVLKCVKSDDVLPKNWRTQNKASELWLSDEA